MNCDHDQSCLNEAICSCGICHKNLCGAHFDADSELCYFCLASLEEHTVYYPNEPNYDLGE